MVKKTRAKVKIKESRHTKILKKHFPTFYARPGIAVIILLFLIAAFWMIR